MLLVRNEVCGKGRARKHFNEANVFVVNISISSVQCLMQYILEQKSCGNQQKTKGHIASNCADHWVEIPDEWTGKSFRLLVKTQKRSGKVHSPKYHYDLAHTQPSGVKVAQNGRKTEEYPSRVVSIEGEEEEQGSSLPSSKCKMCY